MILLKKSFKIFLIILGLAGILVLGEGIWFHHILSNGEKLEKADAIIVFEGEPERIEEGHKLTNAGYAPLLVISGVDPKKSESVLKEYGLSSIAKNIIEDKARTTFENAVYTRQIISERQFNSVILVTSFYHMPRSYFLLRMVLAGSNVRVQTYGVNKDKDGWMKSSKGKMVFYNELVKFWASSVELLCYKIRGKLPEQNLRDSWGIKWLKPVVLFSM